jgi:hypothetical protein
LRISGLYIWRLTAICTNFRQYKEMPAGRQTATGVSGEDRPGFCNCLAMRRYERLTVFSYVRETIFLGSIKGVIEIF